MLKIIHSRNLTFINDEVHQVDILSKFKSIRILRRITPSFFKNFIKNYLIFKNKKNIKNYHFSNSFFKFKIPEILYIKNAHVIGGSSIYIKKETAFFTESVDISRDRFAEEYRGFFKFNGLVLSATSYGAGLKIDGPTLNLMSGVATNYAHWLSECLPRLELFIEERPDIRAFNILVNEGIAETMVESIQMLIGDLLDATVIMVPDAELIYVPDLYLSVGVGYCQFEPRNNSLKPYCYFNEKLMLGISTRVLKSTDSYCSNSKLYLARNTKNRAPANQGEVANLLKSAGFDVLSPEIFSFREQVRRIAGADCVVSPTGASLANCMFAPRGCNVFILVNDSSKSFLEYWTNFLSFNTSNISYVVCSGFSEDPHSSYVVDLENLSQLLIQNHAA